MNTKRSAFTLIELLIVVAIIAILAAIAVPNFLEAQTRAKVSKVYADFRSTGTAIEAYAVDSNNYPICVSSIVPPGDYVQGYARRLRRLTTPIAFMTKVPDDDPFRPAGVNHQGPAYDTSYEYFEQDGVKVRGGGDIPLINTAFRICNGREISPSPWSFASSPWGEGPKWILSCVGPDGFEPWQLGGAQLPGLTGDAYWRAAYVFYDPTNGTVSLGDIYKSQAKSSFQ
jgi:prepilin-type N-terminal cleavage/methylation domain-containing protein